MTDSNRVLIFVSGFVHFALQFQKRVALIRVRAGSLEGFDQGLIRARR